MDYCDEVGEGCLPYMIFAQKNGVDNTSNGRAATYIEGTTILAPSRDFNTSIQKNKDSEINDEAMDNVQSHYTQQELKRTVQPNGMNAVFGASNPLRGDLPGTSGEKRSFSAPNVHPRRAEDADTEAVIACEDAGSLSATEFLANLSKNRDEGEAVIIGLTGEVNTDRYALTINSKNGVVTATWKNRGEYRNQYKRFKARLNSIRQCKKIRASCSSQISLRGIQVCARS